MNIFLRFSALLLISFLLTGCSETIEPNAKNQKPVWPTQGWLTSTPEAQGMDSGTLIRMLENIKEDPYAKTMIEEGRSVESITVIRNGYLVVDGYLHPYDKTLKHSIYSCTKSIVSALVGIAIDKGYIKDVNQPLSSFFPEKTAHLDAQKTGITLEHLLTMSSGLETQDSYQYQWKGLGGMINSPDWIQFVLDLPLAAEPGKQFEYSNLSSYLLAAILHKTTKMPVLAFARQHLFGPLGIEDVKWKADPNGIYAGWGSMMLMPRDMAKIGLLYLNHGKWDGKQIVPRAWVETSTKHHMDANLFSGYGYQWWVEKEDYYAAVGYQGQFIFVVPSKKLVVVFTGNLLGRDFFIPKNLLEKHIMTAVVSDEPLEPDAEKKDKLDQLITYFHQMPEQKITWDPNIKASAMDDVFTYSQSPSFRFKYPKASMKNKLRYPDQVMGMRTFNQGHFLTFVTQRPYGILLKNVGPDLHTHNLRNLGSDVAVISNTPVTLMDGTPAYLTDIEWKARSTWPTQSRYLSMYKNDKLIFLIYSFDSAYTDLQQEHQRDSQIIFESARFDE